MAQQAKCLTKKIITLGKRATGRSSSYEKNKKKYKDKNVWGKNAKEKVIEKQKQLSGGVL